MRIQYVLGEHDTSAVTVKHDGDARPEGVDVDLFLVFLVSNLSPIRVHFVDTRPANRMRDAYFFHS
jgi:hypothetical protein